MIRVAIIEDDREVRDALVVLLGDAPDITMAGAWPDCETGVSGILDLRPDVVLMDIGLPGMSGIEGIRKIRAGDDSIDILVLTILEKDDVVFKALSAGACGYLVKNDRPDQLLAAIREVKSGGAPMSTQIARRVVESLHARPAAPSPLTQRETEVLGELCTGKSYKMIADVLFISEETVRRHLKSIYRKLEVHSKSEAVIRAIHDRLVDP
jgi:DNA-binding NarL/FixJ family response regulator